MSSDSFRHSRTAPPEWADLLACAQEILPGTPGVAYEDEVTPAALQTMYEATAPLSNFSVEANTYYGLGRAMCNFGRELVKPEVHKRVVEQGIHHITSMHVSHEGLPRGHLVREIGRFAGTAPFDKPAKTAVRQLTTSERLVSETLDTATRQRRTNPANRGNLEVVLTKIVQSKDWRLADRLNNSAIAGASIVLRKILFARGGVELSNDAVLGDVISEEEFRELQHRRLMTNCSRVRLDELTGNEGEDGAPIDDELKVLPNGDLYLDHRYLRTTPPPVTPDSFGNLRVSRTERLECPALQAKVIPVVLPYLVEITLGADKLIRERYDAYHAPTPRPPVSSPLDPKMQARAAEWSLFT